ncbi:hypothetical protein SP60_04515 [Candidatus Thioglobus autotrophicus]|jgi:hypothetical protein|uniref:Uncharacterized protein n=1 Tax=Candidatus Thioglobus autotrophicus TaxID=1705394 RepID=A0A0M4PN28_9GAMM|nr:hypothetical protein [Candidatus Thioglobus autotrophicus]ALE52542.1 hypothetical protein SP60_04515 [Candidatus Thioglobus autotrophicus]WPE18106.1 hypothetical protein R5P05_00460 [Candidatus Thioglobus autotrophicus]
MFDTIIGTIKKLTEAGIALIALAVVVQVIFGTGATGVPFIGGDVIGTITGIVASLGSHGLVGLASVAVIYALFTRQ